MGRTLTKRNGVRVAKSFAGRGLFATKDYWPKDHIVRYTGRIYANAECPHNRYLVGLTRNLSVDGSRKSNIARWANHSCKSNARMVIYEDEVWLIAKKHIRPNDEITLNYGNSYRKTWMPECLCPHCGGSRRK